MTKEVHQLTEEELEILYDKVISMRQQVLDLVQEYGFDANQLVSKTFQGAIESAYGSKIMKRTILKEKSS